MNSLTEVTHSAILGVGCYQPSILVDVSPSEFSDQAVSRTRRPLHFSLDIKASLAVLRKGHFYALVPPRLYHHRMAGLALVLGIIGAVSGFLGLVLAARSARGALDAADEARRANAFAHAPDVELQLTSPVIQRWKFIFGTFPTDPRQNLPIGAARDEIFTSPQYDSLVLALATGLRFTNHEKRTAHVTFLATCVATYNPSLESIPNAPDTRQVLASQTLDVEAEAQRDVLVYAGQSLRQWIDAGQPSTPQGFNVSVTSKTRPDGVEARWNIALVGTVWTKVLSSPQAGQVASAISPSVSLSEIPQGPARQLRTPLLALPWRKR